MSTVTVKIVVEDEKGNSLEKEIKYNSFEELNQQLNTNETENTLYVNEGSTKPFVKLDSRNLGNRINHKGEHLLMNQYKA